MRKRLSARWSFRMAIAAMSEQASERSSVAGQALTGRATMLGACLAAAAILGAHWSYDVQARIGLALFLALTACVYLGALLAQSTSMRTAAAEFAVGGSVFVCAWLGLAFGAGWLTAGYALHGGWDWLHHRRPDLHQGRTLVSSGVRGVRLRRRRLCRVHGIAAKSDFRL